MPASSPAEPSETNTRADSSPLTAAAPAHTSPALPSAIIFARASAAYTIPIMNATNAHTDIKPLVRKLLDRDPVQFNAAVNAHFAPDSTYEGRSLKIHGASQLKRTALLFNTLDLGSAATLADEDIRWDAAGSTAIVKATRNVRPLAFPLFEFAVPTRITLTFRADDADEDAKGALRCTHWHDEWPLESLITRLPLIGKLYSLLVVPLLTAVFVWASNVAFWLQSKRSTIRHKHVHRASHAYHQQVRPHLPRSLVHGFDAGVNAAENVGQHAAGLISRASYGPLKAVEELARTATVVANLALPEQLQLPYPSVFAQPAAAQPASSAEVAVEKHVAASDKDGAKAKEAPAAAARSDKAAVPPSPRNKVSGSPHVQDSGATEPTKQADKADEDASAGHAKVVVGTGAEAREIDVVTHVVTEHAPATESAQQSLYDVLKKDNELPHASDKASAGGKKSGGKKKKNGGRK
ncbi:hypothetical protein PaG_02638 [Moesziomyces aphidis]|uniref:Uncharacterized protein n=1 Tax=Moesziomyces aphidis TaxID=84754 RepID=W3VMT8_MOEAP|nr:hypothetical protein PaG_02638 [Moesziomyces aphidis]